MRTLRRPLPPALVPGAAALALALVLPAPVRAQLVVGQYEPEAPVGTWNSFPFSTAPSLAMGGTVYARAAGPASALANPASAARLAGLRIGLDASLGRAEFFRFGPVNTGVLTSRANLALDVSALDWGGISFKLGRWALALNAALDAYYDRPRVDFDYAEGGRTVYAYDWTQTGFLRTAHVALARELGSNLAVGLGVGILSGRWELASEENLIYAGYAIRDERERGLSGFFVNAGLQWTPFPALDLGLALRAPFTLKADSTSTLRFTPAGAGNAIVIRGAAADKVRQPAVLGAGASWALLPRLRLALDLTYLNWAAYEPVYFGEAKARDFRDVLRAGAGVEYEPEIRVWGKRLTLPVRAGFIYDPQPMKTPRSAYRAWTVGAGAALGRVSLDIGACLGSERGSGRNLKTARVSASLGVAL
jgi:hypothetical protein